LFAGAAPIGFRLDSTLKYQPARISPRCPTCAEPDGMPAAVTRASFRDADLHARKCLAWQKWHDHPRFLTADRPRRCSRKSDNRA